MLFDLKTTVTMLLFRISQTSVLDEGKDREGANDGHCGGFVRYELSECDWLFRISACKQSLSRRLA
jgi:hypothetical protein